MKKRLKIITIILTIFMVCITSFPQIVYANEAITYTDVFDDLRKDETFNATDYPAYTYEQIKTLKEDDDETNDVPLLDVITIAEGYDKELYIYVYNPTKAELDIVANEVTLYCEPLKLESVEVQVHQFDLELVSNYKVFDKYIVKDFTVSDETYRYYSIVELSRPFNDEIDTSIEEGITNDKAEAIGQVWCAYYYNDEIVYEKDVLKTVIITPTLTDYVYCKNGFEIKSLVGLSTAGHCHYIAFNVANFNVEKIYDADLVYKSYEYRKTITTDYVLGFVTDTHETYIPMTEDKETRVRLTNKDEVEYVGQGLWGTKYKYNRIMTAQEFKENFEAQGGKWEEGAKEKLLDSQWVFAFAETEMDYYGGSPLEYGTGSSTTVEEGTAVHDIDILRISFFAEGRVYNLGVVADKTTADKIAGGLINNGMNTEFLNDWFEKIGALIAIIGLLVLLVVLMPIFSAVFKTIFTVLKLIFKGIITVILLPFNLIGNLFKPKKRRIK